MEQVSYSVSFKSAMICPRSGHVLACSRLSDSGEDAKEKGTRKVAQFPPVYFPLRSFSIQRAELSRSLEQARHVLNENPSNPRMLIFTNICKTVYVLHTLQEKQREIKELCRKLEEAEKSLKETEDKFV